MKKIYYIVMSICFAVFLSGCQSGETMQLLDENVAEINLAVSNGRGEMNDEIILSITEKDAIKTFKKAITTAVEQSGEAELTIPHYDVMVEYESKDGKLPTHALHLWLGEENEQSTFMYLMDDSIYLTTPKMTKELRKLILSN